jgi:hypothetical protein
VTDLLSIYHSSRPIYYLSRFIGALRRNLTHPLKNMVRAFVNLSLTVQTYLSVAYVCTNVEWLAPEQAAKPSPD